MLDSFKDCSRGFQRAFIRGVRERAGAERSVRPVVCDNAVNVINLQSKLEIAAVTLPNPEREAVVQGRPMLFDAITFSGNGEASCASCHIFGDMDDLAWDLGNPDSNVTTDFHPMKGPFTTQALREIRGRCTGAGTGRRGRSV
jgi:hypothetical protein